MPIISPMEISHSTCDVRDGSTEEWIPARYKWTRPDGMLMIEIRTNHGAKTRKLFKSEDVHMYPNVEVVQK